MGDFINANLIDLIPLFSQNAIDNGRKYQQRVAQKVLARAFA